MARWSRSRSVWVASACLGTIAILALVLDHQAHVLGVLPYLLVLACPLLHLLHGHDHSHQGQSKSQPQSWNNKSSGNAPEGDPS